MKENNIEQKYQQLAEKWMNGSITPEEQTEFATWYSTDQDKPVEVDASFSPDESTQRNRMLATVKWDDAKSKIKFRKLYTWGTAAAIVILTSLYLFIYNNEANKPVQYANDIHAGKQQAVLILANGQRIDLNHATQGQVAEQAGARIFKNSKGEIVYEFSKSENDVSAQNTIETPLAGQYQVILPDQSKVWLNAGSSITFPTSFANAKQREVNIKGEVYFEVAHDSRKPFLVNTKHQQIKVLGTHFNVKAYPNDAAITTTLLEGSVFINNQSILKPDDQAVNDGHSISISQVDPEYAIAWKEGKFKFHNINITDLMKDVARWYNVEVVYQDRMDDKEFSGVVSRFDNVSKLLSVLESTNTIHFKIEGRRITVMR